MREIYFHSSTTDCTLYVKDLNNVFICGTCNTGFSLIAVTLTAAGNTGLALEATNTIIPNTSLRRCVTTTTIFIPDCSIYIVYVGATTANYNFYCITGNCNLPGLEVSIVKAAAVNINSITTVFGCTR